ncbi:TetR family transcriptional regulator [Streptomyces sp. NPDC001770]
MQDRSARTRQALLCATAELIANGQPSDAGLINICRRAGVSRGALYHHYSSTAELAAGVYQQARARVAEVAEKALVSTAPDGLGRFLCALTYTCRTDDIVRAGLQLAADGTTGPPLLRDEVLALVRRYVAGDEPSGELSREELADLAVMLTAGLTATNHGDAEVERVWRLLRPLFVAAGPRAEQ